MTDRARRRRGGDEVANRERTAARPRSWFRLAAVLLILALAAATAGHFRFGSRQSQDPAVAGTSADIDAAHADSGAADDDHETLDHLRDDVQARYDLGLVMQSQGQLSKAIAHYRLALERADDVPQIHNNLAAALASQGKVDEAVAHFRRAVDLDPAYAEAHFNLGNALLEQGDLQAAIGHYTLAVNLKSDYAKAHKNLAVALRRAGRLEEAFKHVNEANRLDRARQYP
jgi:tetratricopeptide (TPR) repeat protein